MRNREVFLFFNEGELEKCPRRGCGDGISKAMEVRSP